METREEIIALLRAALWECGPPALTGPLLQPGFLGAVALQLEEDAKAYADKDPASRNRMATVVRAYTSFRAVLHYRLAHAALEHGARRLANEDLHGLALLPSSRGKLLSGIEIHPRSRIGRRLVIDHGLGTVVGETATVGDDAYILGGVTLGASGIAGNPAGKRHPTLGNRVQVGAFTGIFGPVHIGDDVFIGSHCRITTDIPAGSRVTLRCSHQVERIAADLAKAV